MDWARSGRAPKEAPAEERIQGPRCTACSTPDVPMVSVHLGEHGAWPVCEHPAACRQRAQRLGVWCVYPRAVA